MPCGGYVIAPANQAALMREPLATVPMLPGDRTSGSLSLVEHRLEPGAPGSPLHTHRDEDENSVMLEGRVGAQIGEPEVVAGPGTVLVKPRGGRPNRA
jgi:quercetin dioxygenase-like cupin family protein